MVTLKQLQKEQKEWSLKNFGEQPSYRPLLGAMEELGELAHAHLKNEQGIRGTTSQHNLAKVDAVADIIIYLADYCTKEGIDLEQAVTQIWNQVKKRDWENNKETGE